MQNNAKQNKNMSLFAITSQHAFDFLLAANSELLCISTEVQSTEVQSLLEQ